MHNNLRLRDLYLGAIDAKNELVSSSRREIDRFLSSFIIPPTVPVEDFVIGEKYFVTGTKGMGKTSLLRFLEIKLQQERSAHTKFFLFKSHFSEEERLTFAHAASKAQLIDADIPPHADLSFEALWKWFIYKSLISVIDSSTDSPFVSDDNWKRFRSCVLAPQKDDELSGIRRLIPRLNSGKVSISKSPSLEIDFDWDNKELRTVQFARLTNQADELFMRLNPGNGEVVLFFDELEVNTSTLEKRQRDTELIRDLIIAVEQLNGRCRQANFRVRTIAAIRSEILSAIGSVGKEINKSIADFGVPVVWSRGGVADLDNPLLDIVIKRIQYSEAARGSAIPDDKRSTWNRYFPKLILGKQTAHFLLEITWHRPRDFVRLLNIAKNHFPDSRQFNENSLTASKKEYSHQSWVELTEELATRYSKDDINAIRVVLSGFARYFDALSFYQRLTSLAKTNRNVEQLLERSRSDQILGDLYNVGVLGNKADITTRNRPKHRYRYSFRGDFHPILDRDFVVHPALCSFFGIV